MFLSKLSTTFPRLFYETICILCPEAIIIVLSILDYELR